MRNQIGLDPKKASIIFGTLRNKIKRERLWIEMKESLYKYYITKNGVPLLYM